MRQVAALGIFHVLQQAAGGADGQLQVVAAEALQVVSLELGIERALRTLHIKFPCGLAACAAALDNGGVVDGLLVQCFRGIEAL